MKTKTIGFFNIPESSESDEKLTTVSELVTLTGLSRNTILSAIKTVYPDAIINGKKTVLTQQQVDMVKHQLAVQHQKLINLVNDDTFQNGKVTFHNGQVTQQLTPEVVREVTLLVAPIVMEIIRKQPLRIPITKQLPPPPPQSKRRWIRDVIVRWSNKHMVPVEDTWRNFYHQYYLRFGVNLHIRAKHEGIKPMDVLDNDEDLMLYAIRLVEHLYGEQWLGGV